MFINQTPLLQGKIFYKMHVELDTDIIIRTDKYVSIHETPCFHYCIPEFMSSLMSQESLDNETDLKKAKRLNLNVKRISKDSSRFAFDTKEKAFEHLKLLKRKQIEHLQRNLKLMTMFIKKTDNKGLDSLVHMYYDKYTIPNSSITFCPNPSITYL